MKRWISITYRDFYDFPRIFLANENDKNLLFDCPFDPNLDEYGKTYKVYLMPKLHNDDLKGSWKHLANRAEQLLGEVATSAIEFDSTRRLSINAEIFAQFEKKS